MFTRALAVIATLYACVGSAISLFGWLFGVATLTDWDGDGIAMLANTTVAATAASIGLLLLLLSSRRRKAGVTYVIRAFATVTALIGGLTLSQHIFGWNLGIDTLLVQPLWGERAAASPGRMGPPASTTFLFLGVGLYLASVQAATARRIAAVLAVVATIPPVITWTAYLYGADPLYSLPHLTGIARQTAAFLLCISFSLVFAIDDHGLGALFRRHDAAGMLVRRILPISILLLLVTGWLEARGEKAALYDTSFGNAALTVVRLVMFTALLWWTARAIVLQIERRRSVEAALDQSEERFRSMVNAIPQLAWMARPDGSIYWFNQRWYEYTGTTPVESEGWGWQAVHDPSVLPAVLERWKKSLRTGEPFDMVFPLRGADGTYRSFLTRIIAVKSDRGDVVQWFGTNTDVTEQRAAEDALREANRMKDEFLGTLSHELRTPMSAILGWSQMLRTASTSDSPMSADEIVQGLEVIERNARMQSQIIEDLLDMNRILSGKIRLDVQTMNLSAVVQAAVDAIRPATEAKGVRLQSVCDPNIAEVRGDPNRLQQVFYNLLSNAVKFTPKGQKIIVTSGRVNSHVEVTVSDTGIGIKPDFLPHVFDRFRQQDASTTRTYGGLGLGLGIVKHLVELHGGTVAAASEGEGKGATFTVRLPVSIALVPPPAGLDEESRQHPLSTSWPPRDGEEPEAAEQLTGISALVVDDEPDARHMLKTLLERHGVNVLTAGDAPTALEMVPLHRPDILIFDIGMPVMDGYELIRSVRQLTSRDGGRTPAIALTAFARSEDRTKSLRAGFQMHLSKPVETSELIASIANLAGDGRKQAPPH